ncbi:ATP-binding protein (plasmid) [Cupriavidus necator]|uniref:ATP-binding protein n=1 Tax=Cupriavidus necator TaxID=106590 RepID=A0A367PRC7_CUPNE|nr:ATP-binding protein [Cupriavidus necator]QQX89738.1 ATP-binding protein [Cupriavidus necator]RCJ10462.1 ATP-binding protein [Cupriavidus necator]
MAARSRDFQYPFANFGGIAMAKVGKTFDSVRASRDGHEFHEAWVARKCLGLLLPRDDLVGIAIEGFGEEDQQLVTAEANEIADAVLYFGRRAKFSDARRIVVVQVKYSKAAELKPFRASDAKKTMGKFARTYRACKRDHGTQEARDKLRFELVTNRPIAAALVDALRGLAQGTPLEGEAEDQATQIIAACRLTGKDLAEFAARVEMIGLSGDLRSNKEKLAITLADWSPARDHMAIIRLNSIREMARDKAGLAKQHRNMIARTDVFAALQLSDERDLLPCPASFPAVGAIVDRVQLDDVVAWIPRLTKSLVIHAEGGVGKTVFMSSLAARLSESHETVLFDCFGMGQYRAPDDARHLPGRGLVHIANDLACRGLCDPLLPSTSNSEDILRAFRTRLEQVVATLRRGSADRQLILFLDAIDNANELARDRGQDAFPKLLLQSLEHGKQIPGLQVVVSARSHRRRAATGEASCEELKLQPFTVPETNTFLGSRVPQLTEAMVQVAQSRSLGNARVLEHLAKERDLLAPSEVGKLIELDDLIRQRISDALVEARRLGNPETNIRAFLAGLATLPPPVPLKEFAQANGMPEGAVKSFAADLAPLLEQTNHGLMFRDEPTETLIRRDYAADAATLRVLAGNLLSMQSTSVYAATTLPDLLLQLSDGERLFRLAFDERLPATVTSKVGQQAIRHARLRAAVGHSVRENNFDHLVPLLVEMSTLAAMDQRGTQYLLDHPDLVVTAGDIHSLRRLFEARTKWAGSRHARLAIAHALMGEVADAVRHAQWVVEWRAHHFRQESDYFQDRTSPTVLDMAAIPFCYLANGNGEAAARDLKGWNDWYAFEVAYKALELANRPEAKCVLRPEVMNQYFAALDTVGPLAAAVRFAASNEGRRRALIATLAEVCVKVKTVDLGKENYRPDERAIVRGLLEAAAAAIVLEMFAEAKAIVDALPVAPPRLYTFGEAHWTGEVYPFVARQVIARIAEGEPIDERHLLPRELIELVHKVPAELQGEDFRKALQAALEAEYQAKSKSTEAKERISYDDKTSAERFLNQRLSTWVKVANAFAQALGGGRGRAAATLSPLTSLWKELRIKEDYYSGSKETQRQHNAVGERLLTVALAANPEVIGPEVSMFVAGATEPGKTPVAKVIGLVALLASRPAFQAVAGALAVKASTAIEQEDEVEERAGLFARLGQAVAVASPAEAVEYFRRGLDRMDAIGSGDYRFVDGLMHLASTLQGHHIEDEDSHALSNICELNLGEAQKFHWGIYGSAMAKASGLKGLAKLARWEDRDRISLDYTLLPYLRALVQNDQLDPALAVTLLRLSNPAELYVCGTAQLVATLQTTVGGQRAPLVRELIAQYLQNNPGSLSAETPRVLAQLAKGALGETSWEYGYLSAAAERIEVSRNDYNTLNNWRASESKHSTVDWRTEQEATRASVLTLAAESNPLDDVSVARALEAAGAVRTGTRFAREVLEVLRGKVAFRDWPQYIKLVARQGFLDLYDKEHELRQCKEQWSDASVAVGQALRDCAEIIVGENALQFISSDSLSTYHVKAFQDVCDIDRRTLLMLLIRELSRPKSPVPASVWLNFAAELNAVAMPGVGQAALTRLLQSGPAKLASSTEDGPWKPELYPSGDPVETTAGLIWSVLGSPVAERRWMAAHSLRTAIRLGRADVLDAVIAHFDRPPSFQAPELPFFYLHAQLWLLIAMARIVLEAPAQIARHRAFLEKIALDPVDHHVLRKHFASLALVTCAQRGEITLPKSTIKALKVLNCSPYPIKLSKGYGGSSDWRSRPKSVAKLEPELHLDYDFDKEDVARMANLFRHPHWETVDAMTVWVRRHDADITYMREAKGRSRSGRDYTRGINPDYHMYGEQLCWHALYSVAGDLLARSPVVRGPYDDDDPWGKWLGRQVLTHSDGLWLADGTDWQPVATMTTLRVVGPQGVELTGDPTTLQALLGIDPTVSDWLVVDGDWNSTEGVGIHVVSTLAPRGESIALAESVAAADPFHAHFPRLQPYEDGDATEMRRNAPYLPWVVVCDDDARLDEADSLGASGAAKRRRMSQAAIDFGQLTPTDTFGRAWVSPSGEVLVRSEVWKESSRRRERHPMGARLLCRASFVRDYLVANDADLLLLVRLRSYSEGFGGERSRFWHSTGVVRVTPSLAISFHPGRANELHESEY